MIRKPAIIVGFGLAVWAWCGALMGIGRQFFGLHDALIIHAAGAPIGAVVAARLYFRHFAFTGPLATAAIFVGTALALDVVVVALLIERSFAMFASPLGVWLPLALVFAAVYLVGHLPGRAVEGRHHPN